MRKNTYGTHIIVHTILYIIYYYVCRIDYTHVYMNTYVDTYYMERYILNICIYGNLQTSYVVILNENIS